MSIPVIAASATTASSGAVTTINATTPSGIAAGNYLVMFVSQSLFGTINTPTGWTLPPSGSVGDGFGGNQLCVFVRVADGSEGATVTVTGSSATYAVSIHRITGTDPSGTLHKLASAADTAVSSTTAMTCPTVTTTVVDCLILRAAGTRQATAISTPASHTEQSEVGVGTGGAQETRHAVSYVGQAAAGATGTAVAVATGAAREWCAFTLAIKGSSTAVYDQEGMLYRNDDGSESTATDKAAQDAGITEATGTNVRVRVLVNITEDAPSNQFALEYRVNGVGGWRPVLPP